MRTVRAVAAISLSTRKTTHFSSVRRPSRNWWPHTAPRTTALRLVSLLEAMARTGVGLGDVPPKLVRRVVKTIFVKHGTEELRTLFKRLGPGFVRVLDAPTRSLAALTSAAESDVSASPTPSGLETVVESESLMEPLEEFSAETLFVDKMLAKQIDEVLARRPVPTNANDAYALFRDALARGDTLGKLIQALEAV